MKLDSKRSVVAGLVILLFSYLLIRGLVFHQWEAAWQSVHVRTTGNSFGDARNIPIAAAVLEAGGDPYAIVPNSPYPPFNYPIAWLWLFTAFHLGIHLIAFELILIAGFLSGVIALVFRARTLGGAILCALMSCSPAALLAVERGNVDLLIFFLCFLGVFGAWPALLVATFLKLFPGGSLLLWTSRRSRLVTAISALSLILYGVMAHRSIIAVVRNTPNPGLYSYGVGAISTDLGKLLSAYLGQHGILIRVSVELLFLVLGVLLFRLGRRFFSDQGQSFETSSFLIFGFIFLTTFLAGANYVYRLIFLLPTIPFLYARIRSHRNASLLTLTTLFLSAISVPGSPMPVEAASFVARIILFGAIAYFLGVAWNPAHSRDAILPNQEESGIRSERVGDEQIEPG